MEEINQRKLEHIQIAAQMQGVDRACSYFDGVRLGHCALPELNLAEVDTSVQFLGKRLTFPLLLSSMTGGNHEQARTINRNLAEAAEMAGVAMGVGSQRVMFSNAAARDSFSLRSVAPNALLCANLGAVQLNYGFGLAECWAAVEVLQADALMLHLNPLQEAVQPEGDTNFSGLADKIGAVASELEVPVIVKEVGCGISRADVLRLQAQGVRYIDVAGAGGTSWSFIEQQRGVAGVCSLGMAFRDWGIPTPLALEQLRGLDGVELIATGGIRSGMDMVKAMVMGASLCGMALPFLQPAMAGVEPVLVVIERLRKEFRVAQFLLGCSSAGQLSVQEYALEMHS